MARFRSQQLTQPDPTLLIRFQVQAAAAKTIEGADTAAMDQVLQQMPAGAAVTPDQGLEELGFRIGALRRRGAGTGSGLGHGDSGEFAIQQGTDRQKQTHRQGRQDPETGGGGDVAVGSVQHHVGELERSAVGGTDGFNREGKGIQRR